ncbi:MAG: hypothetical protein Q8L98_08700 [Chlamydiales bacterium]|nr:hypothetical protein [Chlamydiales bacterium]
MSTLTITTSAKSIVFSDLLTNTAEDLTQRVNVLRAELQALYAVHQTTIASLQAEQKVCDLSITDQLVKNSTLQMQNNELRGKVTTYRTELATHRCSLNKLERGILNAMRVQYRQESKAMEKILELLKPPVVIEDPMGIDAHHVVNSKLDSTKCSIC